MANALAMEAYFTEFFLNVTAVLRRCEKKKTL
jgi:hypothetical protein